MINYKMFKYRMFIVTVEILKYNGEVDHIRTFPIKAIWGGEAEAAVHNHMVFSREPKFRITEVKEAGYCEQRGDVVDNIGIL